MHGRELADARWLSLTDHTDSTDFSRTHALAREFASHALSVLNVVKAGNARKSPTETPSRLLSRYCIRPVRDDGLVTTQQV
jgi:hypothetical protein